MSTLVSFHAHPDDEALLTGGTLAMAAAAGHRVVLVVATVGEAGLAATGLSADGPTLGDRRAAELAQAAAALGCAAVVHLGYLDSGMDGSAPGDTFVRARPEEAAAVLAQVLRDERADVLTSYDAQGGYGHPDHRQVHRVAALAASYAGTPVVLEATLDRRQLRRAMVALRWLRWLIPGFDPPDLGAAYVDPGHLTHRIDVTSQLPAKRAALAAHASQSTADSGLRLLRLLLRLPGPVFRRALRHEWYVERGRVPAQPLCGDVFDSLTDRARTS